MPESMALANAFLAEIGKELSMLESPGAGFLKETDDGGNGDMALVLERVELEQAVAEALGHDGAEQCARAAGGPRGLR